MPEAQSTELHDPVTQALLDGNAQPLILRPGDVLIVRTRHHLTQEDADRARAQLTQRLGLEVHILTNADELAVYRPDRVRTEED